MCVYLYLFSWNLVLSFYIMAIFKSHQILHVEKKKTIEYKLLFRRSNGKHHFFYNFLINACIHKLQKILTRKFKFWYGYLHFFDAHFVVFNSYFILNIGKFGSRDIRVYVIRYKIIYKINIFARPKYSITYRSTKYIVNWPCQR